MNPVRSCISCRKREDPSVLLRVVCRDGSILPDPNHRAPGRGAWVHLQCVTTAIERRAFSRAFGLTVPTDNRELLAYIENVNTKNEFHTNYEMDAKDMKLK
jgi:uncharacterized protein